MRARLAKAIVATTVSGALLIGALPAASAQDGATGDGPSAALSSQSIPLGSDLAASLRAKQPTVTPQGDPLGGLEPMVLSIDNVRPGGTGALQLHVVQISQPGIAASDLAVTLSLGENVRVTSAAGDDWTCTMQERVVNCASQKVVADGSLPGPVTVGFDGLPSLQDATVPFRAVARWKQRADAAYTAAKIAWKKTLGDPAQVLDKSKTQVAELPTDGTLKVSARVANGSTMLVGKSGANVILESMVSGINGTAVNSTWRQLCTTADDAEANVACDGVSPVATFQIGQVDGQADAWMAASATIPPLTAPTTFVFEVTASEGGVSSKARVRMSASPFEAARFDPRLELLDDVQAKVAAAAAEEAAQAAEPSFGFAQELIVGRIGDTRAIETRRGVPVKLTMTVPGHRVSKVTWTAKGSTSSVLTKAKRSGSSITFTVPRTFTKPALIITGTATIDQGRRISVDKAVRLTGSAARRTPTDRSLRMEDPTSSASEVATDATNAIEEWVDDEADGTGDADSSADADSTDEWLDPSDDWVDDIDADCEDEECFDEEEADSAEVDGTSAPSTTQKPKPWDPDTWDVLWDDMFDSKWDKFWEDVLTLEAMDDKPYECKPGEWCEVMNKCLGEEFENVGDDGLPTKDAIDTIPECGMVMACLFDESSGDKCLFGLKPQVAVVCTIANALDDGKSATINFTGGGKLVLTKATATPGPCDDNKQLTFTGQELEFGAVRILADGKITAQGLAITGGSFLPPVEWRDIDPKLAAPQPFRITSGGTALAQVLDTSKVNSNEYTWGALAFESTLYSNVPYIDTSLGANAQSTGTPGVATRMIVDSSGVSLRQDIAANRPEWPGLGLTLNLRVGTDRSLSGDVIATNLLQLPNRDGSLTGISAAGLFRFAPRPRGKLTDAERATLATERVNQVLDAREKAQKADTTQALEDAFGKFKNPPKIPTNDKVTDQPSVRNGDKPADAVNTPQAPDQAGVAGGTQSTGAQVGTSESTTTQTPDAPQLSLGERLKNKVKETASNAGTSFDENTAAKLDCETGKPTQYGCLFWSVSGNLEDTWAPLDFLAVQAMNVLWTNDTDGVSAMGLVGVGDPKQMFPLDIEGEFTSSKDWKFAVSQSEAWKVPIATPLKINNLAGTFGKEKGQVRFSLQTGISGWSPNAIFTDMAGTVRVTNECKPKKSFKKTVGINEDAEDDEEDSSTPAMQIEPRIGRLPAEDDPPADPQQPVQTNDGGTQTDATQSDDAQTQAGSTSVGTQTDAAKPDAAKLDAAKPAAAKTLDLAECGAVRLQIDLKGKIGLPSLDVKDAATAAEAARKMEWNGKVLIRFKPLIMEIVGGVKFPDGSLGPKEFKLTEIEVKVTNDKTDACQVPLLSKPAPKPVAPEETGVGTQTDPQKPAETKPVDVTPTNPPNQTASQGTNNGGAPALTGRTLRQGPNDPQTNTQPDPQPDPQQDPQQAAPDVNSQGQPVDPQAAGQPTTPDPNASPAPQSGSNQPWYLAITAKSRWLGQEFTVAGSFGMSKEKEGRHLCLIGISETPSSGVVGDELPVKGRLIMAYSSMTQNLLVEESKSQDKANTVVEIPAGGVAFIGKVAIPKDLQDKLGFSGEGLMVVAASVKEKSFEGKVAVQLNGLDLLNPKPPVTDAERTARALKPQLTLDAAELGISVKAGEGLKFKAKINLTYKTPADPDPAKDVKASSTPLAGQLAITAGKEWGISLAAWVDTKYAKDHGLPVTMVKSQSTGKMVPQIDNAFGVQGLRIRDLGVEAKIGTEFGMAFIGDVTLPDKWGSAVGILPGSQIMLGAKITNQTFCLAFNISRDTKEALDAATTDHERSIAQFSIDMFAQHVVYSQRLSLYLAPSGCELPGGRKIDPGFGLEFDLAFGGSLSKGAPTEKGPNGKQEPNVIRVAANVKLPTEQDPNFAIKLGVSAPAFTLGQLKVEQVIFNLEMDTAKKIFKYRLKGGMSMFGQEARIDFTIDADAANGNLLIKGTGLLKVNFGIAAIDADFDIDIRIVKFQPQTFKIAAQLYVKLLWIINLGVGVDIDYSDGMLNHAGGKVHSLSSLKWPVKSDTNVQWFVTDGWWTLMYKNDKPYRGTMKWTFTIGWDGDASDSWFGPYGKKAIPIWTWKGEHKLANALDLAFSNCVLYPITEDGKREVATACSEADLRGMAEYVKGKEYKLAELKLAGRSLVRANLSGETLSAGDDRVNLAGVDLTESTVVRTKLSGVDMSGAKFNRAILDGSDLSGANLSGADLTAAVAKGVNLTGANLQNAILAGVKTDATTTCPNGDPGPCTGPDWRPIPPFQAGSCLVQPGAQCPGADLSAEAGQRGRFFGVDLTGANLAWAKLTGIDLSYGSLAQADLTGADLRGARLGETDVTGATLLRVKTDEATICPDGTRGPCQGPGWPQVRELKGSVVDGIMTVNGCRLVARASCPGLDLANALVTYVPGTEVWRMGGLDLMRAKLPGAKFADAILATTRFTGADLAKADFSGADLTGADLSKANLTGADLSMAVLTGVSLDKANLIGANLKNATLDQRGAIRAAKTDATTICPNGQPGPCTGASWIAAKDVGVMPPCNWNCADWVLPKDMHGLSFTGWQFQGAELTGVDLSGAKLDGADFSNARMNGADVSKASAVKANLSEAKLANADLAGADLTGVDLRGADLTGAEFAGATLTDARTNARTICPDGKTGPCTGAEWGVAAFASVVVNGCELEDRATCPNLDVTGARVIDLSMVEAQLPGVFGTDSVFDRSRLPKANLEGARLTRPSLQRSNLKDANLKGAQLTEARLAGAVLDGANLEGLVARGIDLTDARLQEAKLAKGDLTGASADRLFAPFLKAPNAVFEGASLNDAYLRRAVLTGANFTKTRLAAADLVLADLDWAVLPGADLTNAQLDEASLAYANLQAAKLDGASMKRARLSGTDLSKASLVGAKLAGLKLVSVDLSGANLRNADLQDVEFGDAKVTGIHLEGADLQGSTWPNKDARGPFKTAVMDGKTICPNGHRATREGFFQTGAYGCFGW